MTTQETIVAAVVATIKAEKATSAARRMAAIASTPEGNVDQAVEAIEIACKANEDARKIVGKIDLGFRCGNAAHAATAIPVGWNGAKVSALLLARLKGSGSAADWRGIKSAYSESRC